MLFLDHLAIGAIVNNSIQKKFSIIPLLIIVTASILPDIPVILFGGPGTIEYLAHRKFTHSLLLAPLYSLVPIIIYLYFILRGVYRNRILYLYFLSLTGYLLHIFFDLITPFGTKLFYPVSEEIFSLDILHSFDPIFLSLSSIIIVFLIWNLIKKKTVPLKLNLTFISAYAVYILIALIIKSYYSNVFDGYIKNHYRDFVYERTVPRTFWRWKGIAKSSNEFLVIRTTEGRIESKKYFINNNLPDWLKKESLLQRVH